MILFILPLVAIIFALATLIFSVISFFKEGHNGKFGIGSSIFSAAVTLVGLFCISVPNPTIYPLNNEATVYDGKAEITIDSSPIFKTYYSLDGSDPKDGSIYDGMFIITKSTTVVARNKFLFWWSDISRNTYRFENIPITISNIDSSKYDKIWISADELVKYVIRAC